MEVAWYVIELPDRYRSSPLPSRDGGQCLGLLRPTGGGGHLRVSVMVTRNHAHGGGTLAELHRAYRRRSAGLS